MPTFLFNEIIFGPVKSRRLGSSLGINLLPVNRKVCNFNCIYCECGKTPAIVNDPYKLPTLGEIENSLIEKLTYFKNQNQKIDTITYAGNGEPTLHPNFSEIIEMSVSVRNNFYPRARIAVLSNGSMVYKKEIFNALHKVEQNILKLDSGILDTILLINCPLGEYNLKKVTENYKAFGKSLIIQTLFLKGTFKGKAVDNSTEKELGAWLKVIKEINPGMVMIYTISRDTPNLDLEKIKPDKLNDIAKKVEKLGIETQISD